MSKRIIPVGQYGHFIDIDAIIEAAKGDPGKSAFQIAKEHGFPGTEEEWLETLKGKSHIDIADYEIKAHTVFHDGSEVKYTPQVLSKSQQDTARNNIGAAPIDCTVEAFNVKQVANAAEEGLTAVRFVPQSLSAEQQLIAQNNINTVDASRVVALEIKLNMLMPVLTGTIKYRGTITCTSDMTSLADLYPVKQGDLYNVVGDTVVINGLQLHNGMLIMATKDIEYGEEPNFIQLFSE